MNDGFINEKVLREYINSNVFNTYNENIRTFLSFIFGIHLNTTLPFKAEKKAGGLKPDLVIKHNGIEKYVSVKKGGGNSVHQERIDEFFPYINSLLGNKALNNLKTFHYGDDTTDDTGNVRYTAKQCEKRYDREIYELNIELNRWNNLSLFLDRFLFIGNIGTLKVDVVYHGTIYFGLWATREEIINYIQSHNFDSRTIHFGPLTYQVWGRNEKRTAIHPDRRYDMQVKWGSLKKNLEAIRKENR